MGCDIHGIWQKREGDTWIDVSSEYDQGQDYRLFTALAGVRAGDKAAWPIAEPRGLPHDFLMVDGAHPIASADLLPPWLRKHSDECVAEGFGMGEHTRSWLTAREMLAGRETLHRVYMTGIVDRATYEAWDGEVAPHEYYGGVGGAGVVMFDGMNDNETIGRMFNVKQWTHRTVNWFEDQSVELAYFFDEVKRLAELHGEVRFVFGFDS